MVVSGVDEGPIKITAGRVGVVSDSVSAEVGESVGGLVVFSGYVLPLDSGIGFA